FSLRINPGDTIVFTRLGYKPVKISPKETAWDLNVMLPETVHMLDQVVVYDNYIIHGHEQIKKAVQEQAAIANSAFKNQTIVPGGTTNMVPTFGPGMVITGALSKLLGTDRERRKISANKAEMIRTQVYYEVMQSALVKQYLTRLLSLSDDSYFKALEKFKV